MFNDIFIDKPGIGYTLIASASGLSSATSVDFDVTAGAANQLAFSVEPSNAESKAAISPTIKVEVQDANGQLINAVTPITLAVGTNTGGGSLAGTLTVGAVGGEATFNDISIEKVGSSYTLVASASGLSSATSVVFHITAVVFHTTAVVFQRFEGRVVLTIARSPCALRVGRSGLPEPSRSA